MGESDQRTGQNHAESNLQRLEQPLGFVGGHRTGKIVPQFQQSPLGNVALLFREKQTNQIQLAVRGAFRMSGERGPDQQLCLGNRCFRLLFTLCQPSMHFQVGEATERLTKHNPVLQLFSCRSLSLVVNGQTQVSRFWGADN